jgi:hypothetical protein
MHDALSVIVKTEEREIEILDVLLESYALRPRVGVVDEAGDIFEVLAGGRGDVLQGRREALAIRVATEGKVTVKTHVVAGGQSAVRSSDFASSVFQALKCLLRFR